MSSFDIDSFLNQEVDANFESEYTPVPEGDFEAQISKVDIQAYTAKKGDDAGQEKPILKLSWRINDPEVTETTGMDEPTCVQSIFLDFSDGVLEEGTNKNIALGKLRVIGDLEANPFRLTDLEGVSGIVRVKHRILEDGRPAAEVRDVVEA